MIQIMYWEQALGHEESEALVYNGFFNMGGLLEQQKDYIKDSTKHLLSYSRAICILKSKVMAETVRFPVANELAVCKIEEKPMGLTPVETEDKINPGETLVFEPVKSVVYAMRHNDGGSQTRVPFLPFVIDGSAGESVYASGHDVARGFYLSETNSVFNQAELLTKD